MNLQEKQKLVDDLIGIFSAYKDKMDRQQVLNELAYSEIRDLSLLEFCDGLDLTSMQYTLLADFEDSCKISEALNLVQFELEADFDELVLYSSLQFFFKEDLDLTRIIDQVFRKTRVYH